VFDTATVLALVALLSGRSASADTDEPVDSALPSTGCIHGLRRL